MREEHVEGIAASVGVPPERWPAVIGRDGASVPAERAADHIFGYTILND